MQESINTLKYILDNVNSWLKFAEGKNGALLVFNSGVIFGVNRVLMSQTITINIYIECLFIFCLFFLVVSACICLVSFVPKIKIPSLLIGKTVQARDVNVLFYGHLTHCTPKDYLELLEKEKIIDKNTSQKRIVENIADQIITNSKIAYTKYIFFIYSIRITITSVVLIVVLGIINIFI